MEEEHMSIIITGSTGELGRLVIADLLASGVPADQVPAVARSEEQAAALVAQGVRLQLAAEHRETEQLILDSGLPYTFLRNCWYSDGPAFTADLPASIERVAITI